MIDQNILGLDIPVRNSDGVQIIDRINELLKKSRSSRLGQSTPKSANIVLLILHNHIEKLAVLNIFHNNVDVTISFECLQQLRYIWVPDPFKYS